MWEFQKKIKDAVRNHWENKLKEEACDLNSLRYFNPFTSSLQYPHHTWKLSGNNPFETHKSIVLAKMLSGRYRTEYLMRHWSNKNKDGFCQFTSCCSVAGTLEHILVVCPALENVRRKMKEFVLEKLREKLIPMYLFVSEIFKGNEEAQTCFLLSPLSFPFISSQVHLYGDTLLQLICYCSRTYVYYIHKERMRLSEELKG